MGDKSPKSKNKGQNQKDKKQAADKVAHDKKQFHAPPAPKVKGKK